MLRVEGWKPWELNLLKGSILVFVAPVLVVVGAVLTGLLLVGLPGRLTEHLLGTELAQVCVGVAQYVGGVAFAFVGCRSTWPRAVDERDEPPGAR